MLKDEAGTMTFSSIRPSTIVFSRRLSRRGDNMSEVKGENADSAKSPKIAIGQDSFEATLLYAPGEAKSRACAEFILFVGHANQD